MLRNYFKIAWRNILKNKTIFGINILGLALGIASCFIIGLFVVDELRYDRFNKKADQLVRVVLRANINGEQLKEAIVAAPVAQTFKKDLPQVEDATRLALINNPTVTYKTKTFEDSKMAYVDSNFFSLFTLPIIKGDAINSLKKPGTLVITKTEAKKYFGAENPIGKVLFLKNYDKQFEITAVMEDMPQNSHFHFDMFASMVGYETSKSTSWVNSGFHTYLLLKKGTDYQQLEKKIPQLIEKYMGPQMQEAIGMSYAAFNKDSNLGLFLQPLTDIHLRSDFSNNTELEPGGNIQYVYIFSAVALFMLLIACINFMNLSTAAASRRAREVGIRKVLGSAKKQLIYQFLTESVLATALALLLALLFVFVSLPFFNSLSGKALDSNYLFQPHILLILVAFLVIISFFAGSYPAFFLSSFKPIQALKNRFSGKAKTNTIRGTLVVFQFVVSAGLILATLVVYKQMDFIQHKNLGYDKDQLLVLRNANTLDKNELNTYKNELLQDSRVVNVTQSAFVPAGESDNNTRGIYLNNQYLRKFFFYDVDTHYIPTMGMNLIAGRNFSEGMGNEKNKAIINQKAAQILGFGQEALGKEFSRVDGDGQETFTVIGIVQDFNFESLHETIEPLVMVNNSYGGLIVKAKGKNIATIISHAKSLWQQFNKEEPFSYTFMDESYTQQYNKEQKMGTVLTIFAVLTVFVACLGLFGLVTYAAEQRVKEIGIRKVLGSSAIQIVLMLSKDFLKPVGLGLLIAFPIGFYLMNRWLQDFAYRIEVGWWFFALTALLTLVIAILTIGFKSMKAALQNPVKSLKTE
ncbi:MAG TPA: FtsX-like permease family protein [Leeuwenhoekiella sp.]|nr:FtsX-like permease family protein [Leeuwenhoekiella sp.]